MHTITTTSDEISRVTGSPSSRPMRARRFTNTTGSALAAPGPNRQIPAGWDGVVLEPVTPEPGRAVVYVETPAHMTRPGLGVAWHVAATGDTGEEALAALGVDLTS